MTAPLRTTETRTRLPRSPRAALPRRSVLIPLLAALASCAHDAAQGAGATGRPLAPAAALERAADATAREPNLAERLAQGDRMRDAGELGKAALEYFRALRTAPESAMPLERIAFLQIAKDPERAVGIFAQLIEENPERASAHFGRGLAQLQRGDVPAARSALERAVELDPSDAEAAAALAMACEWGGDAECAERSYARALELDSGNADVHNNRGMSLVIAGRYGEAAEEFRRALHTRPDDPAIHNNLGLALGRFGDLAGALAAFRAAGDEASALNNLGYVHYLNGDPQRAVEHYERALAARPKDPLPVLRNLRDAQLRITEQQFLASPR